MLIVKAKANLAVGSGVNYDGKACRKMKHTLKVVNRASMSVTMSIVQTTVSYTMSAVIMIL
jgi:hypothetical protein